MGARLSPPLVRVDLTAFAAVTPSADVLAMLGEANYAAIRAAILEGSPLPIAQGGTAGTLGERGFSLLGSLNADLNTTADQAITILAGITKYRVRQIMLFDASVDMSASPAQGGVYSAAAKGGTAIVANTQLYTTLSAASKVLALTISAAGLADYLTAGTLYLSLTAAHGTPATARLLLFGDVFE